MYLFTMIAEYSLYKYSIATVVLNQIYYYYYRLIVVATLTLITVFTLAAVVLDDNDIMALFFNIAHLLRFSRFSLYSMFVKSYFACLNHKQFVSNVNVFYFFLFELWTPSTEIFIESYLSQNSSFPTNYYQSIII